MAGSFGSIQTSIRPLSSLSLVTPPGAPELLEELEVLLDELEELEELEVLLDELEELLPPELQPPHTIST